MLFPTSSCSRQEFLQVAEMTVAAAMHQSASAIDLPCEL